MRLVVSFLFLSAVCGCGASTPTELSYGESARRDYERAMEAYDDGDCLTAEPLFQHVVREYSYSRWAALAELRVADCELAQNHYTEAIRRYRSFVRARPTHAHVDYANFQIAVCYHRQIPTDIFLTPPPEERDQNPTRSALRVVRRFLRDYPDSVHVPEAHRIEGECLRLLARHELYVAGFYLQRDRPLAAVGRLEYVLSEYPGSGLDADALLLLARTYLHMRQRDDARQTFDDLIERFPDSALVDQAQRYLSDMDRDPAMARPVDAFGRPIGEPEPPPVDVLPEPEPEPEPVIEEPVIEEPEEEDPVEETPAEEPPGGESPVSPGREGAAT